MAGSSGTSKAVSLRTSIWVDSGAYGKAEINIEDYVRFIKKHGHRFDVYFSLDVIGDGEKSYKNWLHMLDKGLNPVPVYHADTHVKYLDFYLSQMEGDFIAIGAIADMSTKRRISSLRSLWHTYLKDDDRVRRARVHGFGLTSSRIVAEFDWYSVDSYSWGHVGRIGSICLPRTDGTYNKPPMIVNVSNKSRHDPNHIDNLLRPEWQHVMDYAAPRGYRIGNGDEEDTDYERGLCNDRTMRYQLNALYYTDMGRALGTKVYLAGNTEVMADHQVEKRIQQAVWATGSDYCRMIAFNGKVDDPKIENVLSLEREQVMEVERTEEESQIETISPIKHDRALTVHTLRELEPTSKPLSEYELNDIVRQLEKLDKTEKGIAYRRGQLLFKARLGIKAGDGGFRRLVEKLWFSHTTAYNYIGVYLWCAGRPELLDYIPQTLIYEIMKDDFHEKLERCIRENAERFDRRTTRRKLKEVTERINKDGFDPNHPAVQDLFTEVGEREKLRRHIRRNESEASRIESAWEEYKRLAKAGFKPYGKRLLFSRELATSRTVQRMEQQGFLSPDDYDILDDA